MKDLSHHRSYVQKKVIRDTKRERLEELELAARSLEDGVDRESEDESLFALLPTKRKGNRPRMREMNQERRYH